MSPPLYCMQKWAVKNGYLPEMQVKSVEQEIMAAYPWIFEWIF